MTVATPTFDGTPPGTIPDDTWISGSVRLVGLSFAVAVTIALSAGFFTGFYPEPLTSGVLVGELLVVAFALWLNGRGSGEGAAELLAVSLPLLATALMVFSGEGMRDVVALALPGSLILCGLLLDRRALVTTTFLTVACATTVLLAEQHGWLFRRPRPLDFDADLIDAAAILALTGAGVGHVAMRLRRSHEHLRGQEAALRLSEAKYRGLVDLAADAILVVAKDGTIVEANHRAGELSGYSREELLRMRVDSLFWIEEDTRRPFALECGGRPVTVERQLTRRDGTAVPVEIAQRRMPDESCQAILRDVSERRRAEAQRAQLEDRLRQAQRLEAVGRLAGGVAHDFNNLLTAITGSVTLALREPNASGRTGRLLSEIDKAAWRAAALTRQLLAFSRRQVIVPRVIDLRAVVESSASMLARLIGEDVKLVTLMASEPCAARLDQAQLEQVILNLAANARDAMPNGGTLTLEVGLEGARVFLSVSDTGEGMTDAVRDRAFEPFFTTKPGSGTGLGLAMAYGVVQQHGGSIEVDSAPGCGARFRILFPRADGEPAGPPPLEPDTPGGSETILLAEDDDVVREVVTGQLESLGYRVLSCASGEQALVVAAGHAGSLHLLLSDVVLPGIDGRELRARILVGRPGLKVLFMSGYGEDVVARHRVPPEEFRLIEKPFSRPALARAVRAALGS